MRSIVIGAAGSTQIILKTLINLSAAPELVMTLSKARAENMSAYRPISDIAIDNGIECVEFDNINESKNVKLIHEINPDYIFAIGFSQLIKSEILKIPHKGVIGFHPTALPKYRGRAAIVWQMLLGVTNAKVSMFMIDEGADSGPILGQEPYTIEEDDYAEDVLRKSDEALSLLAPRVIKDLLNDTVKLNYQNEEEASYLLARRPEDGLIDWTMGGRDIVRLIHATSRPYPGAFSFYDGKSKVIFWRADFINDSKYIGFPGQIACLDENNMSIVCRDGLIKISDYECQEDLKIFAGHKFKNRS